MRLLGKRPIRQSFYVGHAPPDLYEALGEVARRAHATAACSLRIGAPEDPAVCYWCGRRLEDHEP